MEYDITHCCKLVTSQVLSKLKVLGCCVLTELCCCMTLATLQGGLLSNTEKTAVLPELHVSCLALSGLCVELLSNVMIILRACSAAPYSQQV